jgi:lactate dehydrogenase-like 2-hydroxyacid dehydrogenase
MKITILCPKNEFTLEQQARLGKLGKITYTKDREALAISSLLEITRDADIVAVDPDNLGGFDEAPQVMEKILSQSKQIKGVALDTTAYSYVDLKYCQNKAITVTHVPQYSTESVAEQTIAFFLGISKKIIESDRLIQTNQFTMMQGSDLKGKTLGVIGLGNIGTRVARLGKAFGMQIVAWNRTPKEEDGITMLSLESVLRESDFLSINLAHLEETKQFLGKKQLKLLKKDVIIVNTADGELVDEKAMAEALKKGTVGYYVVEVEDVTKGPLYGIPNAFLFKSFGWYTKEALELNKKMWLDSIEGIIKGNPPHQLV